MTHGIRNARFTLCYPCLPMGHQQRIYSIGFHGSPKMYNCFLDESLNSLLRSLAVYAHRAKFCVRVFSMMDMVGALNLSVYIAPPHYTDMCLLTGVS